MTPDDVRAVALALPEVTEGDHHGKRAFRLGTRILATQWTDAQLNVMLDESEARAAEGGPCALLWWGKRLSGVRVDLAAATPGLVTELLEDAWSRCAPARLVRERGTPPTTEA
ncbi:MmcQ/YjbR family DNA-binding protein [Blastococcus sp. URHD0036]|uniref:MmcQ/YjbR family DNA-binding protein n=1 Tax=Blastococcus sp. URHD0036 TaxID=1380356 RepID=UPI00049716EC|nr:MmcQ/YjbR family DNA-binding protein [Blastococcus sp. URHD0036]